MSYEFLVWMASFVLQAALLGRTMYALICLSDLENDFINPYDFSARLNRFVIAENAGQWIVALLLCGTGKWLSGGLHLAAALYLLNLWVKGRQTIDSTDVFKQLPTLKRRRIILFGFYILTFVLVTYRLIESAIHSLLTPEGRQSAKRLFQEAAATLHT